MTRETWRFGAIAALFFLFLIASSRGEEPEPSVHGRLVIHGKSLAFARAWLVRGPDTGDATKLSAYLILSSRDLAAAIAACPTIQCVLWDTVQEGAILEPIDDGHESFWLRVLSHDLPKEQQLSGRRWLSSRDTHDRLSGKLVFSYLNTRDEADLAIDAVLVKEFPPRAR